MSRTVDADMYVQLIPRMNWDGSHIYGLKVGPVTSKKPKRPVQDAYTVKLKIRVPEEVFKNDIPGIDVAIGASQIIRPLIAAEPQEPDIIHLDEFPDYDA